MTTFARRAALSVVGLLLALSSAQADDPVRLDFKNTHTVVVGVLSWKDSSVRSFSSKNRKDQELHDSLLALGVRPTNAALLLDERATLENVKAALRRAARRAGPGSTLLFYYAGHGARAGGKVRLLPYDWDGTRPGSGLSADDIASILEKSFRGDRVVLLADCCYSGALARVADRVAAKGKRAVSLSSVDATAASTANWTFTLTVLDGLRGSSLTDRNRDGRITLSELASDVQEAMKYREGQHYGYTRRSVKSELVLVQSKEQAGVPADQTYRYGQWVYARVGGRKVSARVVDRKPGKWAVRTQGYSKHQVVWLPESRVEAIKLRRYPVGATVRVLWGQKQWDAKILATDGDFHFISYPGWEAKWNEWVLSTRIGADARPPSKLTAEKAQAKAAMGGRYKRLLRVLVVPQDRARYGDFKEYGHWKGQSYAGHADVPAGYWVYVYPRWYVWGEQQAE